MKNGPTYFPVTNTGGVIIGSTGASAPSYPFIANGTTLYTMQNVTVTMTSIPVDARGAHNKTFQAVGTLSAITSVAIDASIHPNAVVSPTYANMWFTIGTLATPTWMLIHSGNLRSFRARATAVSNTDNFDVAFMFDDAG